MFAYYAKYLHKVGRFEKRQNVCVAADFSSEPLPHICIPTFLETDDRLYH